MFKMITIYTYPNCEDCSAVKEHLDSNKIEYNEIDANSDQGFKKFRRFYASNKGAIQRDNGGVILPVVHSDGKIIQGVERIVQEIN